MGSRSAWLTSGMLKSWGPGSPAQRRPQDGGLLRAEDARLMADLIVAADGVTALVRDSPGLVRSRRRLPDGATRLLIEQQPGEPPLAPPGVTIECCSGSRHIELR